MEWKKQFKQHALEKGLAACQSRKVFDLAKTRIGYKASVAGRQLYQVSVTIKEDVLAGMRCTCPAARGGVHCEHIAAVLYTIEKELGEEPGEENISEEPRQQAPQPDTEPEELTAKLMEQWLEMDRKLREQERKIKGKAVAQTEELDGEQAARPKGRRRQKAEPLEHLKEEPQQKEGKAESAKEEPQQKAGKAERQEKEQPQQKAGKAERQEKEGPQQKEGKTESAKEGPQQKAGKAEHQEKEEPQQKAGKAERQEKEQPQQKAGKAERQEKEKEQEQEEEQRKKRRLEREQRKEQRARQKEEQKKHAEEAMRLEQEKRRIEEERREKIRQQKAEEARRKAEKKQQEMETKQRLQQKRKEEEMRREQERQREEEALRSMEEARKQAEEQVRQAEEAKRLAQERRKREYTLLGDSWQEDEEPQQPEKNNGSVEQLEHYTYFDGTSIRDSAGLTKEAFQAGERLLAKKEIKVYQVVSGYERKDSERKGMIEAVGADKKVEFDIRIVFSRSEVVDSYCGCPQCRKNYYSWYTKKSNCPYVAGVLLTLENYLKHANFGDATDYNGEELLSHYQKKRGNLLVAGQTEKGSLQLVPRLTRKNRELSVSFKIGFTKLLIVKKLDVFCENVKNAATDTYGAKTQINHNIENFTENGKGWIRFINQIIREEKEFQKRLQASRSYYGHSSGSVGSELNLFGWRLDEFYKQVGADTIEFDDKDSTEKMKRTVACKMCNPKVSMRISEKKREGDNQFHGIKVDGTLPKLYMGTDAAYYIKGGYLNQVDKEFLEKVEPLSKMSTGDRFSFHVGRNNMSEFYRRILPGLRDIVEVKETAPEKFHAYLLPEAQFTFYLDAEESNVTCQIFARYGEREVSVPGIIKLRQTGEIEPFRDENKEAEVLYHTKQLLPELDLEKEELHCGGDEELVYQMMESGTQKLMEMGEVRCTQRFQRYHTVKPIKVSVGVSVASGLLELDIMTEDVPPEELLGILANYRAKKKYYRMKDGSFVNLDDNSVEMLAELMEATHMKPKEFVKGKFHLPMYRTLYLDKMLEENDSVYSSRDSHFRKIVKGFKTVKDADFEEPKSLSKIMRNYQKNGYKWLRTLESWQFGGILADDMGLGKTLQIIAVLLAAKQEGKEGTALVVAPASLVFNWGDEFGRFAPQLEVALITGTQEERREKIEAYQQVDVMVTSYDLLKRDILYYEGKQFAYEVIDEAQYIKNHTTAAAKAVKIVNSQVRFALTGTPIENRLSELWSIFDFLMPGFLYGYDVFKREIETPIVRYDDETAMKRLQKMVGPFILRRLKEAVLKDLPDKLEESRYVRFDSKQQKLYDAQVVHMREAIASQNEEEFHKNKMRILAELTRLRQICCDPSLCFENYRGESAKLDACLELVQSAIDGGHRMLLFSQFTSMLDILKQRLEDANIAYYTITGNTSKEKRLQLVKEFNEGDVPVFLISLKAGGVGLNLTGADVVIHYDPWWNLAVQNQATDRAHRIGQTKKVTVFKLIAKHTIEEKIQQLQETKKNLAEQVISGEGGQLGSMSKEELLALLEV